MGTPHTIKFVAWQEDGAWLGYLQDYPDCWTQGETLDDLRQHLMDLHTHLSSGPVLATAELLDQVMAEDDAHDPTLAGYQSVTRKGRP